MFISVSFDQAEIRKGKVGKFSPNKHQSHETHPSDSNRYSFHHPPHLRSPKKTLPRTIYYLCSRFDQHAYVCVCTLLTFYATSYNSIDKTSLNKTTITSLFNENARATHTYRENDTQHPIKNRSRDSQYLPVQLAKQGCNTNRVHAASTRRQRRASPMIVRFFYVF